ncbi:MAG: HD domain-containing protein [Cyclobacteriaceae bacterium]|nr:HD domain-containing protein [Cyclobacteriaceae bacterium]
MKTQKIFNDPVYGFIHIRSQLLFDIIEHPFFQRLRRIRQLGLSELVFPGANHTRFQHALGAMHLMGRVLDVLRSKGVEISAEEYESAQIAILLHDVGHGPFSHTLEKSLLSGINHESISYQLMGLLNTTLGGALDLSLKMFRNSYKRHFFNQLICSQLDVDRLDYLLRDSYFTGVPEGNINVDRLIQLHNVIDDELVIEEKGIYSLENFLNARRLMYWQVYLHKTSLSAEQLLTNIVLRAKELAQNNINLPGSIPLRYFLEQHITLENFTQEKIPMEYFSQLDDNDLWGAIKQWTTHQDNILSQLCQNLIRRELFKIELTNTPFEKEKINSLRNRIRDKYDVLTPDTRYFFAYGVVSNEAYLTEGQPIRLLKKTGELAELSASADLPNIRAMSKVVRKYYLCWPKGIVIQ